MKEQLKKLFSDTSTFVTSDESRFEEIHAHESMTDGPFYTLYTRQRGSWRGHGANTYRGSNRGSASSNWRSPPSNYSKPPHQQNPRNQFGNISKCNICESTEHWANQCPHQKLSTMFSPSFEPSLKDLRIQSPGVAEKFTEEYEIILHQTDHDSPLQLVYESTNRAVLDCGASKTVAGFNMVEHFL